MIEAVVAQSHDRLPARAPCRLAAATAHATRRGPAVARRPRLRRTPLPGAAGRRVERGGDRDGQYLLAATPIPGHVADAPDRRRTCAAAATTVPLTVTGFAKLSCAAGFVWRYCRRRRNRVRSPACVRGVPVLASRWLTGRAEMRSLFTDPLPANTARCKRWSGPIRCGAGRQRFHGGLAALLAERPRAPGLGCGVSPLTLSSVDTPPFGTGWRRDRHELRSDDLGRAPPHVPEHAETTRLSIASVGRERRRSSSPNGRSWQIVCCS